MSAQYEKLIDLIVSEDQEAARALFHKIVVEQSRKIYEGLVNDEEVQEAEGESDNFVSDISNDEEDIAGDEEGIEASGGEDIAGDDDFTGDTGGDEFGGVEGEGDIEDRVMDLESAIDELKAEFDQLMAAEEGEGHDELGGDEFGGDEFGGDEFSGDETGSDEFGGDAGDEFGSDTDSVSDFDSEDDDVEESLVREYVEKVTLPANGSEGKEIGSSGKSVSVNKRTPLAGKNDMGGSSKNIARGGSNTVPTGPAKPSNAYSKGETKMGQDKYENSPGANTKGYTDKKTAKTGQASGVNNKSTVA